MNMSETMDLQRASGLVGQMVHVEFTTEAGIDKSVEGIVDYVYYESGTPFVSINGELYKAEDVTSVYDATYVEATELANTWIKAFKELPELEDVTTGDYDKVANLFATLEQFSDYTKGFIDDEMEAELKTYVDKVVALKKDETAGEATDKKTEASKGGTVE